MGITTGITLHTHASNQEFTRYFVLDWRVCVEEQAVLPLVAQPLPQCTPYFSSHI